MTDDELVVEALRLAVSSLEKGVGSKAIVDAAKDFHDFLSSAKPDSGRREGTPHKDRE